MTDPEQVDRDSSLDDARAALSPETADRAFAEGRAMDADRAVEYALAASGRAGVGDSKRPVSAGER